MKSDANLLLHSERALGLVEETQLLFIIMDTSVVAFDFPLLAPSFLLAVKLCPKLGQSDSAVQPLFVVRDLLHCFGSPPAGPIIPSSTLKVPKACPPKWIASHILHHFLPSHSHASRSLSSSIGTPRSARAGCSSACSSVRGSGRGGPSSISTDRGSASGGASGSRDSSRSKRGDPRQNEAPTRLTQGRLRGGQGGVLCLSSLGPIAAVNSLKVGKPQAELQKYMADAVLSFSSLFGFSPTDAVSSLELGNPQAELQNEKA
eukprot:1160947-Pelagomonas_calceolata.AAC.11